MALTPYQRKVGVPNAPGPSGSADTRLVDISGSIARFGEVLTSTFEAQHKQAAIDSGSKIAGDRILERDEQGRIVIPEAESGGVYARAAFDAVIAKRYVNEVNLTFQLQLNDDLAARRTGEAPYDAADFTATSLAKLEGVLAGVDPRFRGELSELLSREMLERTRTFGEEVSRKQQASQLAGINKLIDLRRERIARASELGLSAEQVATEQALTLDLIDGLAQWGVAAPRELEAAALELDLDVGDFDNYVEGSKQLVGLAPVIGGLTETELQSLETVLRNPYGAQGDATAVDVGGLVSGVAGATYRMPVAGATAGSRFGDSRDGGTRTHKGVDLPAPAGTAVKLALPIEGTAQVSRSAKGGNIVTVTHKNGAVTRYMHLGRVDVVSGQRVDANTVLGGVGRTGNATGNTLHLEIMPDGKTAVDPLSVIGTTVETPEVAAGEAIVGTITAEVVRSWPSAVRNQALALVTDRKTALREERQIAEQRAAEDARAAREAAQHAELIQTITGALDNGVGGNWNAKQRGALTQAFDAMVDWKAVNTPEMQTKIGQYVATNQYVPESLQNWFANSVRSPNWPSALALYDRVESTTMANGAKVGDMMVGELDADTRALFDYARTLRDGGSTAEEIHVALDKARERTGYTPRNAPAAYEEHGEKGSYRVDRNAVLREVYRISDEHVLPPEFMQRVDASFAANLNVYAGNPKKALELAIKQNQGLMQRSDIFVGGVGPSALRRSYTPMQIQTWLAQERGDDGKPLLPRIKGLRLGESIKLMPLTGSVTRIGNYRVMIYNPENLSQFVTSFEVDLGEGLRGLKPASVPAPRPRSVEDLRAERERRAAPGRRLLERDRDAPFAGPKM